MREKFQGYKCAHSNFDVFRVENVEFPRERDTEKGLWAEGNRPTENGCMAFCTERENEREKETKVAD